MAVVVAACSLPLFLAGALSVQVKEDLALGDTAFGLAFSGYFVLAALCSTTAGRIAERGRTAAALRFSAGCAAVSMLATAGFAHSPVVFLLTIGIWGVAMATAEPAGNVLVMQIVPRDRHGIAIGLKQATYPMVTLLSGLTVPALGLTVGWRWAFVVGAGVSVAGFVLVPRSRPAPRLAPLPGRRFPAPALASCSRRPAASACRCASRSATWRTAPATTRCA